MCKLNRLFKKRGGFDGVIIAIGLILVALIVILVFRKTLPPTMNNAIDQVNTQMTNITSEMAGSASTTNPDPANP